MDRAHYAYRRTGRLWVADFTALPAGACAQLPGMLSHTRASGATVQTGTSTVVSGLGTDVAGIGRALDADALTLVLDEARTESLLQSSQINTPWALDTGTVVALNNDTAPDGTLTADRANLAGAANGKGVYQLISGASGSYWHSWWLRSDAAISVGLADAGTGVAVQKSIGTTWSRVGASLASGGGYAGLWLQKAAAQPSSLVWAAMGSVQSGAFDTEVIPTTGATATRSGARLFHQYASILTDRGRLGIELRFRPKFASTQASPYLWRFGVNSYCYYSIGVGLRVTVAGASDVLVGTAPAWSAGDTLDIWVAAGNGGTETAMRVNGGTVSRSSDATRRGALPVTGALDLLGYAASSVCSSRVERIATYAQGCRPGWAA